MAKYLLSYDEADVKKGNLDVSPDGVLRSAGKSGSDEPVLPQKVLAVDPRASEGYYLWCGQRADQMTLEEAYALCLSKMPFVLGGENWLATSVRIRTGTTTGDDGITVAGVRVRSDCGNSGNNVVETCTDGLNAGYFKASSVN